VSTSPITGDAFPGIAANSDGRFVVVWQNGKNIFAQRFDAARAPVGSEFRANSNTVGIRQRPVASFDGAGGFVVAWTSNDQAGAGLDGSGDGVFGRRFAANGEPDGGDFLVNGVTSRSQRNPSIVRDPDASFMVAWESEVQDGSGAGVFARRFRLSAPGTTTTTLPGSGECGDPVDAGMPSLAAASVSLDSAVFSVADALYVLKAALGSVECAACICDVDGNGSITATDAVLVLRLSLGVDVPLACPPCDG
jgi:hypothetical protein